MFNHALNHKDTKPKREKEGFSQIKYFKKSGHFFTAKLTIPRFISLYLHKCPCAWGRGGVVCALK